MKIKRNLKHLTPVTCSTKYLFGLILFFFLESGGLAEEVDEKNLHAAFVPFGEIKDVKTPLDQATQKHRYKISVLTQPYPTQYCSHGTFEINTKPSIVFYFPETEWDILLSFAPGTRPEGIVCNCNLIH